MASLSVPHPVLSAPLLASLSLSAFVSTSLPLMSVSMPLWASASLLASLPSSMLLLMSASAPTWYHLPSPLVMLALGLKSTSLLLTARLLLPAWSLAPLSSPRL